MADRAQLPRPVLAVAIGLPVLLAAAAAIAALVLGRLDEQRPEPANSPLAVPAVPAPAAGSPHCRALLDGLPDRLASAGTELHRRPLATPAPAGTAAWGAEQPVILRCGLDRPAELTRTAGLLEISGVRWLRLPGPDAASTWVAVDRPVYVALTTTDAAGTGPLQDLSTAIAVTLPAQPVQPAG